MLDTMLASISLDDGRQGLSSTQWHIQQPMIIGREHADIIIAVSTLSRRHAIIEPQPGYCTVRDLGSRNGTAVNGELLTTEKKALSDGDTIVLGGSVQLRYHDPMATPIAPRLGRLVGLWIDPDTDEVWINAAKIDPPLSSRQFKLLRLVDDASGALVTRDTIVATVWAGSSPVGISDDAIDSMIKRLRQRLAPYEQGKPVWEVIRGRGVRLTQG